MACKQLRVKLINLLQHTNSQYITDGLVVFFDGYDIDSTNNKWKSKVGNTYYALNSHSSVMNNHIVMDGTGCITGTNEVYIQYNTGTIEVVYEFVDTSTGAIYYSTSLGLSLARGASGYSYGVGSSITMNQWNFTDSYPQLRTVSINNNLLAINGVQVNASKTTNAWATDSNFCIGGRTAGSNKYYSNVKIYCIRKYNRLLSEKEIIHNQIIDMKRFGI